jgi:single-strand DNA-binding protein
MRNLRNSVQLIGYLVKDPEFRKIKGVSHARMVLKTQSFFRNQNGEKSKEFQWHKLVAWGDVADVVIQYLSSESLVAVEGKLSNRSYTDAKGTMHYITEIVVNEVQMIGMGKMSAA